MLVSIWSPLTRRAALRRAGIVSIEFLWHDQPFTVALQDWSDLQVVREVFISEDYAAEPPVSPTVIVDLGANIGVSVIYFKLRFPDASVVAVEPDPATYALLERNTASLSGVRTVNAAATPKTGATRLHVAPDRWASSMVAQQPGGSPISVPGLTLDDLLDRMGIDEVHVMKIDVEGAEAEILAASPDALARVRFLIGELHCDFAGITAPDFFELLGGFETESSQTSAHRFSFIARRTSE